MHVVFLEFPSNATFFVKENSTLTCIVKAAEGATVQWLFDGQPLPLVEGSAAVCSDGNSSNVTHAIVSETQLPGNFTIFHAELVVRSVGPSSCPYTGNNTPTCTQSIP